MPHEHLTAQQRLESLRRARRKARHRRLVRQSSADLWWRWMRQPPILYCLQGAMTIHPLQASKDAVVAALKNTAVFTLDTASELRWGIRLLRGDDVHAYVADSQLLNTLATERLISPTPMPTKVLFPPHPVSPRLVAVIVDSLPQSETTVEGHRVVEANQLVREFIGAVGMRADLVALIEEYIRREKENP